MQSKYWHLFNEEDRRQMGKPNISVAEYYYPLNKFNNDEGIIALGFSEFK